jgi:hypothetical protein
LDDRDHLPALVALTVKLIPHEVFTQCRLNPKAYGETEIRKNWVYALPIAAIWLLVVFLHHQIDLVLN